MAKQAVEDQTPDFNERVVAVLEQLAENAPVQEIGYGHPKYQERLKAEGFMDEFASEVFQNGKKAQARGLKPDTIEHAPQLKPGKYLGGKVEVFRDNRDRVHLSYASARIEDRMRLEQLLKGEGFDGLIARIWAEMHAA